MDRDVEVRVKVIVTGRVQGVFFRASTLEQAQRVGVTGSVENLPDGAVAIDIQGTRENVEEVVRWVHRGPPAAMVQSVSVRSETPTDKHKTFRVLK